MTPFARVIRRLGGLIIASLAFIPAHAVEPEAALAAEIANLGWIVYSARTQQGDYDLFVARPDGSHVRNLTRTPQFNEFGARFSIHAKKLMYRRATVGQELNHDVWGGVGQLMVSNADGSQAAPHGAEGQFPWASWNADMTRIACLYRREGRIRIFDWPGKRLVLELPRQGIFQQMYWAPTGNRLCGTANVSGQDWKIVSLDLTNQRATMISRNLSCTPDWFQKDSGRLLYSSRMPGLGNDYGWTMLMQGTADGKERTLIYGERGKHIYYGCTSPDDRYVLFSFPETDGGTDARMAIVRLADTPIIVPAEYRELQTLFPQAKNGPVFRLSHAGFEPHWTFADVGGN